jgi:polyferredoxin
MLVMMMIMRMRMRRRERRKADIYKRTLFYIYFILFEISTQFRWLLGNNI